MEIYSRSKNWGKVADYLDKADVVIQNDKGFEDTWKQVAAAWKVTIPTEIAAPAPKKKKKPAGQFSVQRARPQEATQIAEFITRLSQGQMRLTRSDIMAAFGEKRSFKWPSKSQN